ncbi:MAG: 4-hydroxyphenylpyruvate dioxygenase, partial [bacterium]
MAQQTAPAPAARAASDHDFMPLNGIDHVELYVGNALQAAYFYTRALGFREVAYAGLETGTRDRVSHVLEQGRIRLVLTGALGSGSPIAAHHRRHGDGVKVIALSVPDVDHAHREATARGATSVAEPHELSDQHGTVRLATIRTYGETLHTFVERGGYRGAFLPGYEAVTRGPEDSGMLLGIDHIVGNVELGRMNEWVGFYEDVFGMVEMIHFSDEAISTEYSALMSKVVADGKGRIKFPINEPAEGRRKSQIDEYLEFYEGAGAQHIAVATRDIVGTVAELKRRGVHFLAIPDSYYDEVPTRVPELEENLADLREQGILVD